MVERNGTRANGTRFARIIAVIAGGIFIVAGVVAFVAPKTFFDSVATFEPYNEHFIQDIGSFQIGLGAVLLLALWPRAGALAGALIGVGVGSAAHTISHIVGRDLGGKPATDIPMFAVLTALLLAGGYLSLSRR